MQSAWTITAFCDFAGSGGTFAGCTRFFREQDSAIRCYLVEPEGAAALSGDKASNSYHPIQGGGYSGFQYGFDFEESAASDDAVLERDGVTVAVDPMSFQYLMGAEVDYKEDLQGARFVINNPNATTTCGCGSSFSI